MTKKLIASEVVGNRYGDRFTVSAYEGGYALISFDQKTGGKTSASGYQWLSEDQCRALIEVLKKGLPDVNTPKASRSPRKKASSK